MRKTRTIFAGLLAGLTAPGALFEAARYPSLEGSDLNRLRGDAKRVGADFSTVIRREHGKTSNASFASSATHK